jgi:CheY-like chemotaxis protein
VSRYSRNKLDIRKERVELAAIVESAVESSRSLIDQSGHELTVSMPSAPLLLDADPIRMSQVISNLLNNAAKYTAPGGRICLTAERKEGGLVVSVRDNGMGIHKEMLLRVFEMFTQVEGALEQSQGGLGIGLSLVKKLVELHDGSIEAQSDGADQGSEFVIRLPLRIETEPTLSPKDEAIAVSQSSGLRILIVDDNKDAADTLAMLLKLKGNNIRTVYNGPDALQVADVFRPQFVLLDIGLPKLNGYEVAKRIRQQQWAQDTTLIAITGWGLADDRRRSQDAGFNFHVVKPVDLVALEGLINGVQTISA